MMVIRSSEGLSPDSSLRREEKGTDVGEGFYWKPGSRDEEWVAEGPRQRGVSMKETPFLTGPQVSVESQAQNQLVSWINPGAWNTQAHL